MRKNIADRIWEALGFVKEAETITFVQMGQVMYVNSKNLGNFEINLN